jgi:signal transduction histidine kinase
MGAIKGTPGWRSHLIFIVTGILGIITIFFAEGVEVLTPYHIINLIITLIFIALGILGWSWVRQKNQEKYILFYIIAQGVAILLDFITHILAFGEPVFSLYVLPVMYQVSYLSIPLRVVAWFTFMTAVTVMNFLIAHGHFEPVLNNIVIQGFLSAAFLGVGSAARYQEQQKSKIEKMAQDLESGNLMLTQYLDQIEKKHADEIRQFQRLDNMRKQLLDTTTHDIRNPLGIIMGYAQLIETKGKVLEDQDLKDYAEGIIVTADRIKRLIANLLDFTQLETGKALKRAKINLGGFLEGVVHSFEIPARQKKIHLKFIPLTKEVTLIIDPNQMQRVFENLISNAMKFTPEGGEIVISTLLNEHTVTVKVQDTGMGIPAEAIPNLFKPFYRVKSDENHQTEGSGLGLAIVRSIVEQHGGEIQVESQINKGSAFKVILPL